MDITPILDKLKITSLSDMQTDVAEAFGRTSKDILILSPTGSGKTLAYLLPLVQSINVGSDDIQAVAVVPNRELAIQSDNVLRQMGTGIRSAALYGGRPAMEEHRMLRKTMPHIIFATPGRLNDHIDKQNINPFTVKYLVIDEFDKCLEMGFLDEMAKIAMKMKGVRRKVLLSATEESDIPRFINMKNHERIDYITTGKAASRVSVSVVRSSDKDKLNVLYRLLCRLGDDSSIVFLNYRDSVERTDKFLQEKGFSTSRLHGAMDQKEREDALYRFSNGSANIFVSTDLASRGLDIPDVRNIIHYHLPLNEPSYIHRVGRTARWKSDGSTFVILGPEEHLPDYIDNATDYEEPQGELPQPSRPRMATLYIGKGKKDKISKMDVVGFLCKKCGLVGEEIGRIDVKERYTYVAVKDNKIHQVIRMSKNEKIKGVKTIFEIIK